MGKVSLHSRVFAVLGGTLLLAGCTSHSPRLPSSSVSYADLRSSPTLPEKFVVLGDSQRTLPVEQFLLREESNDPERERLFGFVRAEHPSFLVIVGDLTAEGSSETEWDYFDKLTLPLREDGVAFLPAIGNHDYWLNGKSAMELFSSRFEQIAHGGWYSRQFGNLALIWLDTNFSDLSADQQETEKNWYNQQIQSFEKDPGVSAVMVFNHEPPFTNSYAPTDDEKVKETFLPAFMAAKKTVAMISGHAHTYEHFIEKGKTFIVSGGGGGARVALKNGKDEVHADLFSGPSPRPFHYLLITPQAQSLKVTVKGFQKGETALRVIDEFEIPTP